jgi:hypothetical protein
MMEDFIEDGTVVIGSEPTAEQIAEYAQWALDAAAREQAELDRGAILESAIMKLADLGLTAEEAQAVIGI